MTPATEHDLSFRCMGSEMRVLIGEPLEPGLAGTGGRGRALCALSSRTSTHGSRASSSTASCRR